MEAFFYGPNYYQKRGAKKILQLIYKSTIFNELIAYMNPKLQFFACHNFVARWQDKMFKSCLENFPIDTLVSIVDFA
jgi:hypothetical protein